MEIRDQAAGPISPATTVPLGKAWSTNSVNAKPYRQSGLITRGTRQFCVFYNETGLSIVERNLETGSVRSHPTAPTPQPTDAHFSPSMGVDPDGHIHILAGAHVTRPIYLKSRTADIESMEQLEPTFGANKEITYPMFVNDDLGDLYLIYRIGRPARSAWRVKRWDGGWVEGSFPIVSGILSESWPAGPYLNTPVSDVGHGIGLFVVWRTESIPHSKQQVMNIGIDYFETDLASRSTTTWNGVQQSVPITPPIAERVIAIPWGAQLGNQSGATRLPDGRPVGTFHWQEDGRTTINIVLPVAGKWVSRRVDDFASSMELEGKGTLSTPHSRPVCAAFADGTLVVVVRSTEAGGLIGYVLSGPDYEATSCRKVILSDENFGDYEPVIDNERALKNNILSLYIQHCGSTEDKLQGSAQIKTSDAAIVEWKLDNLA